jgi:putative transposase
MNAPVHTQSMHDADPDAQPIHKRLVRREFMFGARYLTCSCYRRQSFFDDDWAKQEFVDALVRTQARHGFGLIAWVIMPEHVHLLLIPRLPESPVPSVLLMLKSSHSRRVLSRWRKVRSPRLRDVRASEEAERFWQAGGGHDRNPDEWDGLVSIIRYIHRNPVARGLVENAADWPWSSIHWYLKQPSPIKLVDPRLFRQAEFERLKAQGRSTREIMEMMRSSTEKRN